MWIQQEPIATTHVRWKCYNSKPSLKYSSNLTPYTGNLDYEVLANALSQATHMHIDQEEVDDAMLHILNDAESTIAETNSIDNLPPIEVPRFVSMTEFLVLMVS